MLCKVGSVNKEKVPWGVLREHDCRSAPVAVLMGFGLWPAVPQGCWTAQAEAKAHKDSHWSTS